MPNRITEFISNYIAANPISSSEAHRNAQLLNGGVEIANSVLTSFSPAAEIPGKIGQIATSFFTFFRNDIKLPERLVHGTQFFIAGTQLGLDITLLFNGVQCGVDDASICTGILLLKLLYDGTLLVTTTVANYSQDPPAAPAPPAV